MGIDEASGNEGATVIVDARLRVARAQIGGRAHRRDTALVNQNRAVGDVAGSIRLLERISREMDHLTQK